MSKRSGYRGYIASRPIRGETTPQHVQNLVIRDYCAKLKVPFLLSATEYAMPSCYMILESALDELPQIEGLVCFSFFMLPQRAERRRAIYDRVLKAGATLHSALEGIVLRHEKDIALLEDIFMVDQFSVPREAVYPVGLQSR